MPLAGRIALVTAGGRGIGRAIALGLAEDGADVAVNYRSDARAADEVVRAIEARGRRARALRADVSDPDACRALVEAAAGALGPVDLLVCNAGTEGRERAVAETDAEELLAVLRLNAVGPHQLARAALPGMRRRGGGDVVMLSSVVTDVR